MGGGAVSGTHPSLWPASCPTAWATGTTDEQAVLGSTGRDRGDGVAHRPVADPQREKHHRLLRATSPLRLGSAGGRRPARPSASPPDRPWGATRCWSGWKRVRWADSSAVLVPIELAAYSSARSCRLATARSRPSSPTAWAPGRTWTGPIGHGLVRDPSARRQRPPLPRARPGRGARLAGEPER